MKPSIKAICFDVGGTLRVSQEKTGRNLANIQKIQTFINKNGKPQDFLHKLTIRENEYRNWSRKHLQELSEADIWSKFMLPDHSEELIRDNAIMLNQLWRESRQKIILPDAVHTLKTLYERGYILAIISNTTSSVEVPQMLEDHGLTDIFRSIILSTVHGRRKPHPSLFLDCAESIGLHPQECAYVGDMISRDVVGGRQAGFSEITIINVDGYSTEGIILEDEDPDGSSYAVMSPDFRISKLSELLELYPDRRRLLHSEDKENKKFTKIFDIALSTMWHVDQKIPFGDTFHEARKAGFARFELNHRVSPELFKQWDQNEYYISTVHDPCPAEFTNDEFKVNDFLISSLDERKRIIGVDITKKTIETAIKLGSRSIVIHPGMIMCDYSPESQLKKMYNNGLKGTTDYDELKVSMISFRKKAAPPHVEQVLRSLSELIEFARGSGIEIGLENRYHFYDIPLIGEMKSMLDLCDEDWYGFQYDVGHAQVLSELGFVDHEEWLKRFGKRIIGVHLQDVIGILDHQLPGIGDIDYQKIKEFIPPSAHLTLEVNPGLSIAQLEQGLEKLSNDGIIKELFSWRKSVKNI
jgi:HAD superfamily hydrolase (TIGR01549 family)